MKKVLLFLAFITFINMTFAQGLKFGIGGGLSLVQSPKAWTEDINNGGAGFKTAFNIAGKVKLKLPLIPLTPTGMVQYSFFNGSYSNALGEYKTSMNVLTLAAGGEFSFLPGPLSPYAGLDIMYNNFMEGKVTFPGGSSVFSTSASRVGLGIGVGVEFNLIPMINFDLSAKYKIMNLVGKETGEESVGILDINLFVFF